MMIDLRSDTVTQPTEEMRAAMFSAPVGDDVFMEDRTAIRLEETVAELLGKEAALFVPSGTMANQIAVRLHCRPGEELLCDPNSHVVLWEGGAPAALSGVTLSIVPAANGLLSVADLESHIRPSDIHSVQTRLVWLENTHNRCGGRVHSLDEIQAVSRWARSYGLALHLDGARLWNAIVASDIPASEWAKHFDTVSVCFSKGLGAPVGSALVGSKKAISTARRYRKLFGGAMRQIGFLAGACLYAMNHHVERLVEDHANAQILAEAVSDTPGLNLVPPTIESNLVWVEVDPSLGTPHEVATRWRVEGVHVAPLGGRTLRMVTHLDVRRTDCERAARVIRGSR